MRRFAAPLTCLLLVILTVQFAAQAFIHELKLIEEAKTVNIASRYQQPISHAASPIPVITDEDIRQSGAPDFPTTPPRTPGLEVMKTTGADCNVNARDDNRLNANRRPVLIDGCSMYIDAQGRIFRFDKRNKSFRRADCMVLSWSDKLQEDCAAEFQITQNQAKPLIQHSELRTHNSTPPIA